MISELKKIGAIKKFYTKKETAELLGVAERTVLRYLQSGALGGATWGRVWRISDTDIEAFYNNSKKQTEADLKKPRSFSPNNKGEK